MSMMMSLLGGGAPDINVSLPNGYPYVTGYGYVSHATYRLGNDKKIYHGSRVMSAGFSTPTTYTEIVDWCAAGGTVSDYEVRATVSQGSLTSGTTGTWQSLGTTRDWVLSNYSLGTVTCEMQMEIRNASTQRRVALATVLLTVSV